MKIPKHLSQFNKNKTLFIVCGRLVMKFYLAFDGQINKFNSFSFPKPSTQYTDNEGHFQKSSNKQNNTVVSGSVRESKKERLRQELYRKFKKHLIQITKNQNISKFYLFAPDYLQKEIKNLLKNNISNKLKPQIEIGSQGNYTKTKALDLIKIIDDKKNQKLKNQVKPIKKDARQIYKKAIKATKTIKGKPSKKNPYK